MSETIRPTGVRINIPDTFQVEQSSIPTRRRSIGPLPRAPVPLSQSGSAAADTNTFLKALESQGLRLVDTLNLGPTAETTPPSGRRREEAPSMPETQTATIEVDVDPDEHAVVLLDQNGMYSWSLPEDVKTIPAPGTTVRRGTAAPVAAKRIGFRVEIRANDTPGPATRLGLVEHIVYDRVKAYVLKYAAKLIVHEGVEYLERDSQEKLLIVDSSDPAAWRPADGTGSVAFPKDRPARALLLVHGTFSNTIGSFGGLAATPWGEQFIQAVKSNYDIVLGFDHFTLKRDPAANASTLMRELEGMAWPEGSQIDVIAFSRGGLVVRCLMDQLSPHLQRVLRFRRAIFVACANEGTQLAEPDKIRAFIDLYTNLATAAYRLMGMLPQAKAVTVILKELIQGMASLVKYIATIAVTEGSVPGLAAMQPGGTFLTALDRPRSTKSALADVLTYVITSEFVPRLSGADIEPKELPARFLALIAGGFVTQLMKEGNDLVVNASSMAIIAPQSDQLVYDRFDFGKTAKVYHTIYFLRPEVVNALTQWLELVKPKAVSAATTRGRKRSLRGAQPATAWAPPPAVVKDARALPYQLPAQVDARFVVVPAHSPAAEIIDAVGQNPQPYVVVKRFHHGKTLHYSFPTEDVLAAASTARPDTTLEVALNLRESDRADERSVSDAGPAVTRPAVVLAGDHVLGVIPKHSESSTDIIELANAVLTRSSPAAVATAARAMPVFEAPPAEPTTTLHLRAEMDDSVVVGKATSIDVTLSREMIGGYTASGAGESSGTAQIARKVVVQAIPISQFKIVGDDRFEVDVPAPSKPWTASFDVKPTNVGDGEIWIVMSQDQATLSTIVLSPKVVENRGRRARISQSGRGTEQAAEAAINQLLILEMRNGSEMTLFFQFQSPVLGIIDKYYSRPFKMEPRDYVKNLYQQIEDRWVGSSGDAEDFTEELRSFGAGLFAELFPETLQSKLWKLRDKLKKVLVISTEPLIPWELVHLTEPNKPLGADTRFFAQMGVVRWLHQAGWPPSTIRVRSGRVRHVIPNYPDPKYALTDVEDERQFMKTEFESTEIAARPGTVRTALQDPQGFDVLHFACHGSAESDNIADARIMLEGRVEGQNYVPEYLNAMTVEYNANLRNVDGNRPLVFVNACQAGRAGYRLTGLGGFAQAFLSAGAGIFAGTLWSVGDQPASAFAKCFYRQLKAGAELSDAAIEARKEARKDGDASWLCYVVYGHPSARVLLK